MNAAHTPGPWAVRPTPESSHQDFIVEAGKWSIASIDHCASIAIEKANACLIAAAPELLACLRRALIFIEAARGGYSDPENDESLRALYSTIAKATGETA